MPKQRSGGFRWAGWLFLITASVLFLSRFPGLARQEPIRLQPALWLAGGLALGAGGLLWPRLRRSNPVQLAEVFHHEVTHLLVALGTFQKVYALKLHVRGSGEVAHSHRSFLVALAPYCFPTAAVAAGGLYLAARPEVRPAAAALVGMALAFHGFCVMSDFRFSQPDIQQEGRVFSTLFVAAVLPAWHAGLAGLVLFGVRGLRVALEQMARLPWESVQPFLTTSG